MYLIVEEKKKEKKKKKVNMEEIYELEGFLMTSKTHAFHICNQEIKNVMVISKKLAYPLVLPKVEKKYKKLIELLTELLISDDDSGDSIRHALNQIEKFRLEIKNKYRAYLKRKDLELMAKQLSLLQKEANRRYLELQESYYLGKQEGKNR